MADPSNCRLDSAGTQDVMTPALPVCVAGRIPLLLHPVFADRRDVESRLSRVEEAVNTIGQDDANQTACDVPNVHRCSIGALERHVMEKSMLNTVQIGGIIHRGGDL